MSRIAALLVGLAVGVAWTAAAVPGVYAEAHAAAVATWVFFRWHVAPLLLGDR